MTDSEFHAEWIAKIDELRYISLKTLETFTLDPTTKNFLLNYGLPQRAAPFLSFEGDSDISKYESINLLTNWFDFLGEEYKKYIVIGSDGSGDVITINSLDNCKIEWLDHEDYFSSRFMNTSIKHLALCLLAYKNFVQQINIENGDGALIEGNFTDAQYKSIYNSLKLIDERAIEEGFWKNEMANLLANKK